MRRTRRGYGREYKEIYIMLGDFKLGVMRERELEVYLGIFDSEILSETLRGSMHARKVGNGMTFVIQ